MQYREFQHLSTGCSRSFAADPCRGTVGANTTEGYAIGETDFECWGRLWKAFRSDPEVDGEEWVTFVARFRRNYEISPMTSIFGTISRAIEP